MKEPDELLAEMFAAAVKARETYFLIGYGPRYPIGIFSGEGERRRSRGRVWEAPFRPSHRDISTGYRLMDKRRNRRNILRRRRERTREGR